jgi:hypothetical protein
MPRAEVTVSVEILHTADCGHWRDAVDAVRRVAAEAAVTAAVLDAVVDGFPEALELRFVGSPTVRVNGRDVQAEAEERTDYGLG